MTTLMRPGVRVVAVPVRSKLNDAVVELDRDAPAHGHDHRLTEQLTAAGFPVLDEVGRDDVESLTGTDDRFEPRPLGLGAGCVVLLGHHLPQPRLVGHSPLLPSHHHTTPAPVVKSPRFVGAQRLGVQGVQGVQGAA